MILKTAAIELTTKTYIYTKRASLLVIRNECCYEYKGMALI